MKQKLYLFYRDRSAYIFFLFGVLASILAALGAYADSAKIELSPQTVAERVLSQGLDAKLILLTENQADYAVAKAEAPFDWNLTSDFYYKLSRFESLTGLSNLEDKTRYWTSLIQKKLPSGTTLGIGFTRTMQDSLLNPNSSVTRPAQAVMDQTDISLTQELAPNFFGLVERESLRLAKQARFQATLQRKDDQQTLLLQSMQAFWDTYVAKETLRESSSAEDKYAALVEYLAKKANQGFSNPADLPKARAEYELKKKALKESSLTYLDKLQSLLQQLNLPLDKAEEVKLAIPAELPPLPNLQMKMPQESRQIQIARFSLDNAEIEKKAAALASLPSLSLLARASYNGVERLPKQSFADMSSGVHPEYYLGFSVAVPLWSANIRGEQAQKNVLWQSADVNLQKKILADSLLIASSARGVQANYLMAKAAMEAVRQWEIAIAAQERLFKQGRVDVAQIILDYNSYFRAQSERTRAIGDYHMALNTYAAARDRLVE